jgi:peroxiredoxin Q/BCP
MSIAEGATAPDFDLQASGGRRVTLAAMKGAPFLLYFYPKAGTAGCTKQACDFQEALPALGGTGVPVIGVSPDPIGAIETFAAKHGLGFPLASDASRTVAEAYGTWIEKSMYGRRFMGMERATFLIDAQGRVARIWRKVKVPGHAGAVMEAAAALG